MKRMNKKDLQIIAHLRNDGRMQLTKLSSLTGMPLSTVFDKLRYSEKELITKYICLLDFSKLGYNLRVNIAIRVGQNKDDVGDFLVKNQSVNSVSKVTNGYDFMIEGVFKQIKDLEEFMEQLETKFKIEDKKYFFILEDLKKEGFLSNPDLVEDSNKTI